MKSSSSGVFIKTYLLWLFGGFFGLHHFYLGRDKHGFITLSLFGGYFGCGVLRDLWRLPEYIRDATNDKKYLDSLHDQMKMYRKPPSSFVRQSASLFVGSVYAHLASHAVPNEILSTSVATILSILIVPLAASIGVWIVGNVGRHQGSIVKCLLAAYISSVPSFIPGLYYDYVYVSPIAAHIIFNRYCLQWKLEAPKKRPIFKRFLIISFSMMIYLSLCSSALYFNCTIKDPETNQTIKCRAALENLLQSQAFANLSEAFGMLIQHVKYNGFGSIWTEIMQEFDVSGKTNAYNILGLKDGASPEEILKQYKKLSREYHPDRERDESKKAEKHEKFIQVQQAFKTLEVYVDRHKPKTEEKDTKDEL